MKLIHYPRGNWKPTEERWVPRIADDGDPKIELGNEYPIFLATFGCAVVVHPDRCVDATLKRYQHDRFEKFEGWANDIVEWVLESDSKFELRRGHERFHKTLPLVLPVDCGHDLAKLWWEARLSVCTASTFSTCCCARGAIEYAVTEIGWRIGLWPEPHLVTNFHIEWPVRKRFERLTIRGEDLQTTLHDAYTFTNSIIHSAVCPTLEQAVETLEIARLTINELYSRFQTKLSPLKDAAALLSECDET